MPWSETNVVEQRMQFVMEWKKSETTMTSLSDRLQVDQALLRGWR
jgi:hypothetical protein